MRTANNKSFGNSWIACGLDLQICYWCVHMGKHRKHHVHEESFVGAS